jgi:hypothetical protein
LMKILSFLNQNQLNYLKLLEKNPLLIDIFITIPILGI